MRTKSQLKRSLFLSAFVIILTAGTFSRLTGIENIRAIHIVSLLTCGAAIGIFFTNLAMFLRTKE